MGHIRLSISRAVAGFAGMGIALDRLFYSIEFGYATVDASFIAERTPIFGSNTATAYQRVSVAGDIDAAILFLLQNIDTATNDIELCGNPR